LVSRITRAYATEIAHRAVAGVVSCIAAFVLMLALPGVALSGSRPITIDHSVALMGVDVCL
jgi:hypothetical protein